ncbi:MAG: YqjD family protein [Limisphaerales bacterium]
MNEEMQSSGHDSGQLAQDAQNLIDATADIAGDKVEEARNRLAAALDRGKQIYGRVREKAVQSAKATDQAVRENPYQAIDIGVGVGVIIGFLLGRRGSRD